MFLVVCFAPLTRCVRNRHALDLRLMSDARVVILDASNTLYPSPPKTQGAGATTSSDANLVLQPIPKFQELVQATCQELGPTYGGSKVTLVDVGVICHSTAVRAMGRALYTKIQQALKDPSHSIPPKAISS